MANVRNERKTQTAAGELSKKVEPRGGAPGPGRHRHHDRSRSTRCRCSRPSSTSAWRRRPPDKKPFDQVVTIFSLLPDRQDEKLP